MEHEFAQCGISYPAECSKGGMDEEVWKSPLVADELYGAFLIPGASNKGDLAAQLLVRVC